MVKKINFLVLSIVLCSPFLLWIGCGTPRPANIVVKNYPSGLKVIIQEIPDSKVSALQFWIKTGSINETPEINGISHFLEHLLFKGTKNRPSPNQIFNEMESLGAYFNAATSYDFTYYYIDIPAEKTFKALEVLSDLTLNPLWPAPEIEKERKVVIEELRRGLDDPDRELYEKHAELIFGKNHPYGRTVIGPQKNLEKISRDTLIKYFKTWYNPAHLTIVIAGPISKSVLLKQIEKEFSLSQGINPQAKRKYPGVFIPTQNIEQSVKGEVKNTKFMLSFLVPGVKSSDSYALDLIATYLGSGRSAKLYQILKAEKNIVESIGVNYGTRREDSLFTILGSCDSKNLPQVKKEILVILENLKKTGLAPAELNKTKQKIVADKAFEKETVSGLASDVGYYATVGKEQYAFDYLKNIKKVTTSDTQRIANQYFKHYFFTIMEPK